MSFRFRVRSETLEESRPRVWLTTEHFDLLDRAAKAEGITYSAFVERIVRAWCVEREALERHEHDVFHNAMGQELIFPEANR